MTNRRSGSGIDTANLHAAQDERDLVLANDTLKTMMYRWRAELTPRFPALREGYYDVPTAPGWGIEVNEPAASAHPYDPDAKLNMFAADWEEKMCR